MYIKNIMARRNYAPYIILIIMYLCGFSSVFASFSIIPFPIGSAIGLS